MITRAIIEQKIDEYKYRVRIPIFDKSASAPLNTKMIDLCIAVASMPKGIYNSLQEGDVVIIGFENNESSSPIILGHLYRKALTDIDDFPSMELSTLQVNNQVKLPANTSIGTLTYENLFALDGATQNIQLQLDQIFNQIDSIQSQINAIKEQLKGTSK